MKWFWIIIFLLLLTWCSSDYETNNQSNINKNFICGQDIKVWKYTYTTKILPDWNCWTTTNMKHDVKEWKSWCYDDNKSNCDIYWKLYDWDASLNICKWLWNEWKLPSDENWSNLELLWWEWYDWNKLFWLINNLLGYYNNTLKYNEINKIWTWWVNWEKNDNEAFVRALGETSKNIARYSTKKNNWYSVVCINESDSKIEKINENNFCPSVINYWKYKYFTKIMPDWNCWTTSSMKHETSTWVTKCYNNKECDIYWKEYDINAWLDACKLLWENRILPSDDDWKKLEVSLWCNEKDLLIWVWDLWTRCNWIWYKWKKIWWIWYYLKWDNWNWWTSTKVLWYENSFYGRSIHYNFNTIEREIYENPLMSVVCIKKFN